MTYDYGRFVWFEHLSNDEARAAGFYGETVGWKTQSMPMPQGAYTMIVAGENTIAGYSKPPKDGIPPHWVSYVSVEDVDATAKKVIANGGKALMDAFDIPGVGRMQPVADPFGAAFFLFHGAEGDRPAAEGAGAFHWNELMTTEPEKAVDFYEKVLGYTHETMEMPEGTYFVLKNGDAMRGGVMKKPMAEAPNTWFQYVTVDDCDAAVERAKKNGGTPLGEPMDVPGVGRFAHLKDPVGAAIGVITPAKQ